VAYTPSARALIAAQTTLRKRERQAPTLAGVGNPLPNDQSLKYAAPELAEIVTQFAHAFTNMRKGRPNSGSRQTPPTPITSTSPATGGSTGTIRLAHTSNSRRTRRSHYAMFSSTGPSRMPG
jgi:hypothetical protein